MNTAAGARGRWRSCGVKSTGLHSHFSAQQKDAPCTASSPIRAAIQPVATRKPSMIINQHAASQQLLSTGNAPVYAIGNQSIPLHSISLAS